MRKVFVVFAVVLALASIVGVASASNNGVIEPFAHKYAP